MGDKTAIEWTDATWTPIRARRVGDAPAHHGEHMTTYGINEVHCGVAARIGRKLQEMIWSVTPAANLSHAADKAAVRP